MQSNTTLPDDLTMMPEIKMQSTNLYFGTHHFTGHSLYEMSACYEACRTVHNVIAGLVSQPRYHNEQTDRFNEAGETLYSLMDFVDGIAGLVADTARAVTPVSPDDHERRAWLLLRQEAFFAENLADFSAMARQLASETEASGGAA
ncbi:hypothetical protein CQZ93_13185 [Ochrobactrum vermis]|nr:hypothetical protein CQZ93_13185 [Ochrobactrum vermis]